MQTHDHPTASVLSPLALETLLVVNDGDTLDDIRVRVEAALGLSAPMPMAALRRMLVDEEYFHNLIATRTAPEMLAHLLRSPGNRAYEQAEAAAAPEAGTGAGASHSSAHLVAEAATAFVAWSKGGFVRVDDEVFQQRIRACLACDKLSGAPKGFLYKVAGMLVADDRTCTECGCVVAAKARLPHENCPLPGGTSPDLSRWGEPLRHRKG